MSRPVNVYREAEIKERLHRTQEAVKDQSKFAPAFKDIGSAAVNNTNMSGDTIQFYMMKFSPPCRAVWMLLKHMGLKFNTTHFDLFKGEQMNPGFMKVNPRHCVPTIVDNGFVLWESRAILQYLVNQYGKGENEKLYPKDPRQRAKIDSLLQFDLGALYNAITEYGTKIAFHNTVDPEKEKALQEKLAILESMMDGSTYIAGGSSLTIADLSILASLSFLMPLDFDFSGYKNISTWLGKMRNELPSYKECIGDPVDVTRSEVKSGVIQKKFQEAMAMRAAAAAAAKK